MRVFTPISLRPRAITERISKEAGTCLGEPMYRQRGSHEGPKGQIRPAKVTVNS